MAIIAVDLGTTNTVALFKEPNRRPIWVTEQNGLPSLAIKEGAKYRYTDNGMLYGTIRNAKRRLLIEHENITSLKWIDGKETLQVNRYNPQTEVNETDLQEAGWEVVHQVNYDVASVEEARNAIKTIVHEIRNRLEAHLARPLLENDEFIFSVPAQVTFYNQILREILLQDTWPINNFQVFPEPFAVLLEYLDGKIVPGSYLIMDIGGGTTDWIGIMIDDKQNFNQIFSFRQDVGGSDIDRVLLDLIVPNVIDDGIRSNLLYQIEQNKITVSQTQDKAIGVFHSFEWVLTYEHLLDIVQDVFSKYITEAYEQLRHYVFDYIILAGGGSLSPGLKKMVSKQFQRDVQQIDTERISYACAEGLIRAREQQDNIVSGLDQKVGYWDIIEQSVKEWLTPFVNLPMTANRTSYNHTLKFSFENGHGYLPLFVNRGTGNWIPYGVLHIMHSNITLIPVWNRQQGLLFYDQYNDVVEWIQNCSMPMFHTGMPIAWESNMLVNQRNNGTGVIDSIGSNGSPTQSNQWMGLMEKQPYITVNTGNATVKVKTNLQNWYIVDLGLKKFVRTQDLAQLRRIHLSLIELEPYKIVKHNLLKRAWFPSEIIEALNSLEKSIEELRFKLSSYWF